MNTVVIIGTGNVARHLFTAFQECTELKVLQVVGRNREAVLPFEKLVKGKLFFRTILDAQFYIIAVSDDVIGSISKKLADKKGILLHTSGSVSLQALPEGTRRGVFYPLQTFSKNNHVNFKKVPICIDAQKQNDLDLLRQLASLISDSVHVISFEQRKSLHLAAVFVNNFVNHMFTIGKEICQKNELSFSILEPLIVETLEKIKVMSPYEAQTGPARRGDKRTMENHIELLNKTRYKELYSLLSQSILETYGEKL